MSKTKPSRAATDRADATDFYGSIRHYPFHPFNPWPFNLAQPIADYFSLLPVLPAAAGFAGALS